MSQSTTWKKMGDTDPKPPLQNNSTEEQIIVPDTDVFDLKDYVLVDPEDLSKSKKSTVTNPTQKSDPINVTKFASETSVNPENLRSNNDQKYFYQGNQSRHNQNYSWFLVTFLMTLVILGGLYFFFLIQDKDAKISLLERQISNRNSPQVKGVSEVVVTESKTRTNPITITSNSINAKNFSISTANNSFDFKNSETSVSINYFNNQIGTKNTFILETENQGQILQDSIEILSAEKQNDLNSTEIVQNTLKFNSDFELDSSPFNSANKISFTLLKPKSPSNRTKIYIGTSSDYAFVVKVKNGSFALVNNSKITSFLNEVIAKTTFN